MTVIVRDLFRHLLGSWAGTQEPPGLEQGLRSQPSLQLAKVARRGIQEAQSSARGTPYTERKGFCTQTKK